MNAIQLNQLERTTKLPLVLNGDCLGDRSPRTLIFGYDSDSTVIHTYVTASGHVECIRYTFLAEGIPILMSSADDRVITSNAAYVPEKYALPEASDFEFCDLLKRSGEKIQFAVLDTKRPPAQYHGLRLDYFKEYIDVATKSESNSAVSMLGLL